MKKYFVSKDQNIKGPYSIEEIQNYISAGELTLSDYIFNDSDEDWLPIMQHEAFIKEKPKVKPNGIDLHKPDTQTIVDKSEWFVLRGEKRFGPFEYLEVIKMLQEQSLYEYDFVWNPSLKGWCRVAELRDFSPEKLRNLMDSTKEVFFRRKHPRAKFGGSLILHDNFKVWKGENLQISEGGCSVKVFNSMLQPGDSVFIHFKPNESLPPFHAKGEVVSKRFDPNVTDIEHPIIYGVRFLEIEGQTIKQIRQYSKKQAA